MNTEGGDMFSLDAIVGGLVEERANVMDARLGGNVMPYQAMSYQAMGGGAIPHEPPIEQYAKILKSYTEWPKNQWATIPIRTYIRYMTNDGKLKTGGRIKSITKETDGSLTFAINKYAKRRTLVWEINSKKISNIYEYTKVDPKKKAKGGAQMAQQMNVQGGMQANGLVPQMMYGGVSSPNQQMQYMPQSQPTSVLSQLGDKLLFDDKDTIVRRLDMLEARTQRIEQDLKKIFMIVKRMYEQVQPE